MAFVLFVMNTMPIDLRHILEVLINIEKRIVEKCKK